ncbi:hypothetical protein B5807_08075 [Epicoccum nigrum]|uniref:Uncharacterized protein n=1 Tax=Epicoccum nigrum TaxID=105696 RepID=A0A1Y2LQH8_EPING|nr:hypothetical protein B5807_08075 [Epicoccum nigrum]
MSPIPQHAQPGAHPAALRRGQPRVPPAVLAAPLDTLIVPAPLLPTLPVQIVSQQHLQRGDFGAVLLVLPLAALRNVQPAQPAEVALVDQGVQVDGGEAARGVDAGLARGDEGEGLQGPGGFPHAGPPVRGHVGEARVDVVEGDGQVGQVGEPLQHAVEAAVLDVGQVAQLHRRQLALEVLQQRSYPRVVQPRGVQDGQAAHAGREVVGLAQQIPEELAVDASGQAEVLHLGGPAHVDAQRPRLVLVGAPGQVDGLDRPEPPQRLRQALEADALAHQAQVQHPQPLALGQAGPAVDREAGLRRDEHVQPLFRAPEQARCRGLCALVDDVREVEDAHQVGEVLLLDVCEDRGADGADEEVVGAPCEEGRVVQRLDRYIIPLSRSAPVSACTAGVLERAAMYLFTAQKVASVDCLERVSQASM